MTKLENVEALESLRAECQAEVAKEKCRILICSGTGCLAGGSDQIYENLLQLAQDNPDVEIHFGPEIAHGTENLGVHKSGCHGFCEMGPLVRIEPAGILYTKVQPEDAQEIFEKTICKGEVIDRLVYQMDGVSYVKQEEIPFYKKQTRTVLEHCGRQDADHIGESLAFGAYKAFVKALTTMTPEEVAAEVETANLRGRGGAGFNAGVKWKQVAAQKDPVHYVVCNGDEGDPGAFMDRSVMEGDPHKMIEGMMIAAYACRAQEGYIYVRAEYPLAIQRLKTAIAQAEEYGLLGDNILGTDFSFRLHINRGAGAFVCGEGSALTASIEGNRGMPRVKPPRSTEKGLFEKPTSLNNVETFANVPAIINNGAAWYKGIGTEGSSGTKIFALTGSVKNTGLIEVPMGTTLREIIFEIGGGVKSDLPFKAVQLGGPSGGCLTTEHLDVPLDFETVKKYGAIVGSGGLVVMDESSCMVEIARFFMSFTQRESCGKCTPCREGTKRMLEILEKIVAGKGTLEDIDRLEEIANFVHNMSLCGLGKTAPTPVLGTLANFRDEYIEHVTDHKCRAHACQSMKKFVINPDECKGCSKCSRNCPVDAISGVVRQPFTINQDACIRCGTCMEGCPFGAIHIED